MLRLFKKINTVLSTPGMLKAYARWNIPLGQRNREFLTHFGARVGGFENFSNYWGTSNNVPGVESFEFFSKFVDENSQVVLDIGANLGLFSLILARRNPDCRIHAFEPAEGTFELLQRNLEINHLDNVSAHRVAILDETSRIPFLNNSKASQRNRVVDSYDRDLNLPTCEVSCASVDGFLEENNIERVGFIKIDCEGVEPRVLKGCERALKEKRVNGLLVEICPRNLKEYGFNVDDVYRLVGETDYSFYRLQKSSFCCERLGLEYLRNVDSEDLLLLPNDSPYI